MNMKIRLFIIFTLGIGFVIYGIPHFSPEKEVTRIPRVLYPLYEQFGTAGLGVVLMAIGVFCMLYAIFTYKRMK
ncbi:hypothetical protein ID855_02175 [Xenorhabdus sp. ZM]|uniref:hypothetical protein n=1 Tax=Xenorhabdus szentirmaii TaxID=290112 RepID=UPI0019A694FE|nr:hypothetical protein [Xenorhabdus sp. ZM]MBD2803537.1 hypothetical protein [Xenorhabdus sp. ZM]